MIVAGVMSGTSSDGIDVALVQIEDGPRTKFKLLGHTAFPYAPSVRKTILATMNSERASVADLARLNFLLGELYGEAILASQKQFRRKAELIGCHGQTIYHQGIPARFLGRELAVTWQTGEGAILAARVGVPVVSDFRPADMAAGGKGAPLVPYLDYLLFRDDSIGRIALNLGGIANITAIPAGGTTHDIIAFDTGPGNMVIDALAEQLFGKRYDKDGRIAASGRVAKSVVSRFLAAKFFRERPPKTAGREEFGREFVKSFLSRFTRASSKATKSRAADMVATATALTARSISEAVRRYVLPEDKFSELIVSGGGAKNPTLMAWLADEAAALNLHLRSSDEFGIPSEAKEAVAFAVLAFETWNRRPSNVPAATGAKRPAVLGKVSYP